MDVYISADIEGVAGIAAASEGDLSKPGEYGPFQRQMTAEVAAACRGAFAAGAQEVVVKDAHWTGRNLDLHALDAPPGKRLRIIRGWSGHPFSMVQDINPGFAAAVFIGYHSAAGSGGNPLSHTMSSTRFARVELNGVQASECLLFGYAAASVGVPLAFLSGDEDLCNEARSQFEGLVTVATLRGTGASVNSISPAEAVRQIEAGVERALSGPKPRWVELPARLQLKLRFNKAPEAYAKSFYPGARQVTDVELVFETDNYLALLTFLSFAGH